jgi:hypothetical protein
MHISKLIFAKHTTLGPVLEVEMSKKCTPLWREARLEVKMHKAHHARRCSAKHISKSQCEKHYMLGPLLEVAMSKKCTPLWREAYFENKIYKTRHVRTTFGSLDDHFWKFRCRFAWQVQGIVYLVKSDQNMRVFIYFQEPW